MPTSASTAAQAEKPRSSTSSRSISNSARSEFSTRTSRAAPEARDLAAELGADRAAGAGDEDGLSGEVGRDRLEVDLDRLAAEDVLHLHGPDLHGEVDVACDQLVQPRQRLHRDRRAARHLDDLRAHAAGRGRNRDQHLVGALLVQDRGQVVGRAQHADPVHAQVAGLRIVVDEADRRVAERGLAQDLLDDQVPGVAGADDDDLLAAGDDVARDRPLEQRTREHARTGDEGHQQEPVHDRHRARQPHGGHRVGEVDDEARDHAGDGHPARRAPHVPRGHVAPPAVVEAEGEEGDELDADHDPDRALEQRAVEDRHAAVEAELEGERPGGGDQHRVDGDLPEPVLRDRRAHPTLTARACARRRRPAPACPRRSRPRSAPRSSRARAAR